MLAIKSVRRTIERDPDHPDAAILSRLVLSLESGEPFPLSALYDLPFERFELALQVLAEWRLDRYFASKAKLLDISVQMQDWEQESRPSP